MSGPFQRKRPCGSCPFRSQPPKARELPGEGLFTGLRPAHVGEIAASLRVGAMFPCHKSVDYSQTPEPETTDEGLDDEDVGGWVPGDGEHWCAGALAITLSTGEAWSNPGTRFAAHVGMFDPAHFTRHLPMLYPDLDAWVAALTDRYERMTR